MKTKTLFIILTLLASNLKAQWNGAPGDISYNTGKVGIGTPTPNAKLHIPNGDALIGGSASSSLTHLNNSLGVISKDINSTTYPFYVGQPSGSDIFWLRGNGNAFLLGKLGLGTNAPNAKLHIPDGDAIIGGSPTANPAHLNSSLVVLSKDNNAATYPFYVGQPGGKDIFWVRGNGNAYFLGQLGIGTLTPDAQLTVAGDIHSREVRVSVNAGADFVFIDDYDLRTLADVEQFIHENKHLPDIEPAKVMEEKGLELGKMDIKLLQKIEELTLYMIDFKKEMDKLKEENQKLKERIIDLEKS